MSIKKSFVLDWHVFLFDFVIFILGVLFSVFSKLMCECEQPCNCPSPLVVYIGLVLIFTPLIHFFMSVIVYVSDFISGRIKKK